MLVLSRKNGEDVVIGHDIHITVLNVRGNKVRLGITAPNDVTIRRAELACRTGTANLSKERANAGILVAARRR